MRRTMTYAAFELRRSCCSAYVRLRSPKSGFTHWTLVTSQGISSKEVKLSIQTELLIATWLTVVARDRLLNVSDRSVFSHPSGASAYPRPSWTLNWLSIILRELTSGQHGEINRNLDSKSPTRLFEVDPETWIFNVIRKGKRPEPVRIDACCLWVARVAI